MAVAVAVEVAQAEEDEPGEVGLVTLNATWGTHVFFLFLTRRFVFCFDPEATELLARMSSAPRRIFSRSGIRDLAASATALAAFL